MIDVSSAQFEAEVVQRSRSGPVIVDFWAPWCGPCRTLGPVLERLEAESARGGAPWTLAKVNTDENAALGQRFQIQGIPAVKAFVDGRVVAEFVGAQPEAQVRAWLAGFLPDAAAVAAAGAARAEAAGDASGAAALYAEALRHDPQNPAGLLHRASTASSAEQAWALLARLRPRDRMAHAAAVARVELCAGAPALADARAASLAGGGTSARWDLARALLAAPAGDRDPAEALEILFGIVRADRAFAAPPFGSDAARKAMLAVFDVVVAEPGGRALADEFRRRLTRELQA